MPALQTLLWVVVPTSAWPCHVTSQPPASAELPRQISYVVVYMTSKCAKSACRYHRASNFYLYLDIVTICIEHARRLLLAGSSTGKSGCCHAKHAQLDRRFVRRMGILVKGRSLSKAGLAFFLDKSLLHQKKDKKNYTVRRHNRSL